MFTLNIITREERPPEASVRAWDGICRAANQEMGTLWHTQMLAPHFTPQAKGIYHHQPRSRGYLLRKQRMAAAGKALEGGLVDNLLTGLMRSSLEAAGLVRAVPTRVIVTMIGPRYCTMRPYKSGQPDKAKEITTITDAEEKRLAKAAEAVITQKMNALKEPKTTTNGRCAPEHFDMAVSTVYVLHGIKTPNNFYSQIEDSRPAARAKRAAIRQWIPGATTQGRNRLQARDHVSHHATGHAAGRSGHLWREPLGRQYRPVFPHGHRLRHA